MKTILVINGPNLNMLGRRDESHYGSKTLSEIESLMNEKAKELGFALKFFQSNHEGALIDFIQENSDVSSGIIINPGALTHYSYALLDALLDAGKPTVEVHLSDIFKRDDFRRTSVIKAACLKQIMGKKEQSYLEALEYLVSSNKY